MKCGRKRCDFGDVPGADVLVEIDAERNALERLVTWPTSQALMSWLMTPSKMLQKDLFTLMSWLKLDAKVRKNHVPGADVLVETGCRVKCFDWLSQALSTVQYSTVQYSTVQYQYSTVQYSTGFGTYFYHYLCHVCTVCILKFKMFRTVVPTSVYNGICLSSVRDCFVPLVGQKILLMQYVTERKAPGRSFNS